MNDSSPSWKVRLAFAIAIILFLALVFITLFFAIGQPFGSLNDVSIGLGAVLSAALAWRFYPTHRTYAPRASMFGLIAACIGVVFTVVGMVFVISGITGYVLSGWYTEVGYALIGLWLLLLCDSARRAQWLPRGEAIFGMVIGVLLLVGFLAIPGILAAVDSMDQLIWYLATSQISFLGIFILFPAWCFRLARFLATNAPTVMESSTAVK